MNNERTIDMKIALIITIFCIMVLGICLNFIPNSQNVEYIESTYIKDISNFVAEKSECIQYIVLTITFPLLFVIFYKIISKKIDLSNNKIEKYIDYAIIIVVFLLFIKVFLVQNSYIKQTILQNNFILFCVGFILISIILRLYSKHKRLCDILVYTLIVILIGIIAWAHINGSYIQSPYMAHHVDAYFYPIYKINSGLVAGTDFNSIYGYYSYFFSFLMNLFNQYSMLFFSIIIAILIFISLGGLAIVANKMIKNKIILLLTVASFIFTMFIQNFIETKGYYLQYEPHRIIFPILLLLYSMFYIKLRNSKYKVILQIGGFVISSLAIVWNLETGIIVLIVWIGTLLYETLYFYSFKEKKLYIELLKIVLMSILAIALYFIFINTIIYIKAGQTIKIKDILFGQLTFWGSGFNMLRMPLWHPWMLVILIYAIAIALTIRKLKFMNKNNKLEEYVKNSMIFTVAILGIGIFLYYQGRSHNEVFLHVIYPALVLCGAFLDELLIKIKNDNTNKVLNISISLLLFFILIVLSLSSIYSLWTNNELKSIINKEYINEKNGLSDSIEMMNVIRNKIGQLDFIMPFESYYYYNLDIKDKKCFSSYVDIFKYEECKKIIDYLEISKNSLYMTMDIYNILEEKYR